MHGNKKVKYSPNALSQNTQNCCAFVALTHQVLHPYKTKGNGVAFNSFNLSFFFYERRGSEFLDVIKISVSIIYISVTFFMNVIFNYCYYSSVFEVLFFGTAFVTYHCNSSICVIPLGKSPTIS